MKDDGDPARVTGAAGEWAFSLADLPGLRDCAAAEALRRGMREEAIGDFLVALNEVATNAVTHGSARARLGMWREGPSLVVAVYDGGREWCLDGEPGDDPPPEYATSGMGLWVARLLSNDIRVTTGPRGTTVTMRFLLEQG
ncbi:MAG: ATP-binding protein [Thermobispora bispora]|nr:ATP-binding protein [Thermobispora bispora]